MKTGRVALFLLFFLSSLAGGAWGAKFNVKSSMSVQEQYNDNIFLTEKNKTSDFITTALPHLDLKYKTPFWKWNAAYTMTYQHYADGTVSDNFWHNLNVTNRLEPIRGFFYIDTTEQYTRTSLSLTRNYAQVSPFVNQTDTNDFTVTPHFKLRPWAGGSVDLGYTYTNLWYKSALATGKQENEVYAEAKDQVTRNLGLTAGGDYLVDHNNIEDYHEADMHAGLRYRYALNSHIFIGGGDGILTFRNSGTSNQPFWDAGINRWFAAFTMTLETSSQFFDDPTNIADRVDTYSLSVASHSARTPLTLSLGLSDYRDIRTRTLQTVSYWVTGALSHKFTPAFTGSASLTAQRFEDKTVDSYTNRILPGFGLEYTLSRVFNLTLNYLYIYSHSPILARDRYLDNQLTAGITARF